MSSARAAAFDLGTNTFLALVAELDERGELRVVADDFRMPRLGEGVARTGRIGDQAAERGARALRELVDFVARHGVEPARRVAAGTAVFRRAANAGEFVERARRECGLAIEVLSGEQESALGWLSAASSLPVEQRNDAGVIDVGGGSTEFAWDGGRARVSASVGAVVLTEQFLGGELGRAWSDAEWKSAREAVESALAAATSESPRAKRVVAIGGSAANLAALEAGFARFEPARTEGLAVTADGAFEWAERLRRVASAARADHPIERERAAILPAGLLCLGAALSAFDSAPARASGRGLRYGRVEKFLRSGA